MSMRYGGSKVVVMVGWLAGCGPLVLPEGDSQTEAASGEEGTTAGASGTTALPPGTTTVGPPPPPGTTVGTTLPPSDESTSGGMTSIGFLDGFDDGHFGEECDLFQQDCPRGEKCMPWANDGGSSWNALRCSPIVEDADAVGEPCVVEGSAYSGIDSCAMGSMCWDVDPETLEGECVAFCVGDEAMPLCEDPGASCSIGGDSVLALCFPVCDPLLQDCDEGEACLPLNETFNCIVDVSGELGAPGDGCDFINVCDPGTFCAAAELVPGCDGPEFGCCTPFCDVDLGPLPCLPGQECVSWWEPGQAPPELDHVGACALPT
jgi:hypothetical protein